MHNENGMIAYLYWFGHENEHLVDPGDVLDFGILHLYHDTMSYFHDWYKIMFRFTHMAATSRASFVWNYH